MQVNETNTQFFASMESLEADIVEKERSGWMVRSVTSLHWDNTSKFCVIYEITRMAELRGEE